MAMAWRAVLGTMTIVTTGTVPGTRRASEAVVCCERRLPQRRHLRHVQMWDDQRALVCAAASCTAVCEVLISPGSCLQHGCSVLFTLAVGSGTDSETDVRA